MTAVEAFELVFRLLNSFLGAAGLLVSIGFICYRRIVKPMHDLIQAQLTINGGGSLVDRVARIDTNHKEAESHWMKLEKEQTIIRKSQGTVGRELNLIKKDINQIVARLKSVEDKIA